MLLTRRFDQKGQKIRRGDLSARLLYAHEVGSFADPFPSWQRAGDDDYFLAIVTERRSRPFRRRRDRTLRPPGVCMRLRNPWVRRRLLLWGWYVRFTTISFAEPGFDCRTKYDSCPPVVPFLFPQAGRNPGRAKPSSAFLAPCQAPPAPAPSLQIPNAAPAPLFRATFSHLGHDANRPHFTLARAGSPLLHHTPSSRGARPPIQAKFNHARLSYPQLWISLWTGA